MISDQMLLSDVPEIQGRDDAGVSATSSGHAPPATISASPPPSRPRTRLRGAAHAHATARAGTTSSAAPILVSKPSPTQRAREHHPAHAPVLQGPHRRPQRAHDAQDQQRVRVVVARDGDRDRRQRQHRTRDEPARAAEAPRDEVVDEPDRRDAHQRLRHEHRPRVEAEHAHGQRLHPQRHRRLVDRHHAAGVQRAVQERVPRPGHRAHRARVVLVRPPVARQRPQVQRAREHEQDGDFGAGESERAHPRAGGDAQAVMGRGRHASSLGTARKRTLGLP